MHLFAPYKSCGLSECMQGSQLCQLYGHAPTVTEKIGDHLCMHTREVLRSVRRLRPLEHSKQLRSQYCTRPKAQPMDIPNGACEPPIGTRAIISSESRVPKLPCGLLFYRSSLQRSITRTYQFRRLQLIYWCCGCNCCQCEFPQIYKIALWASLQV